MPRDVPLRALSKAALFATMEIAKGLGRRVPELHHDQDVLVADGMATVCEFAGDLFPHLHGH